MSTPEEIVRLDRKLILRDATRELSMPSRRLFGKRAITLGGLLLLTGCRITDEPSVESFLMTVSRFNDRVQAWLFDPRRLAPTYPESELTRPFPFNAYYGIDEVRGRRRRSSRPRKRMATAP
ncbi:molybdopterin-binding protein [Ralstonia phage RPZH6]|nr:molybdopterin-binding protein [Ralstonia phage RPZH6]